MGWFVAVASIRLIHRLSLSASIGFFRVGAMIDPSRSLYRRLGLWRYAWWLLWVSVSDAVMVRGVYVGFRWRVALAFLYVSRWSRR
jgi:hypothetical protein